MRNREAAAILRLAWVAMVTAIPGISDSLTISSKKVDVNENEAFALSCSTAAEDGGVSIAWSLGVPGMGPVKLERNAVCGKSSHDVDRSNLKVAAAAQSTAGSASESELPVASDSPAPGGSAFVNDFNGVVNRADEFTDRHGVLYTLHYQLKSSASTCVFTALASPAWDGSEITCSVTGGRGEKSANRSAVVAVRYIRTLAWRGVVEMIDVGFPASLDCKNYVRSQPEAQFFWMTSDRRSLVNSSTYELRKEDFDGASTRLLLCEAANPATQVTVAIPVWISLSRIEIPDETANQSARESFGVENLFLDSYEAVTVDSNGSYDTGPKTTAEAMWFIDSVNTNSYDYIYETTPMDLNLEPDANLDDIDFMTTPAPYLDLTTAGSLLSSQSRTLPTLAAVAFFVATDLFLMAASI